MTRVDDKHHSLMGHHQSLLVDFATKLFLIRTSFVHFPWSSYSQLNDLTYVISIHVHANNNITCIVDGLNYKYSIHLMIISTRALHAVACHTTSVSVKIVKRAPHLIVSDGTYHESTQRSA